MINRIRSNDRSVLGELFVKHRAVVESYVRCNGGDKSDVDDMLQEAIVVLWQNVCSGQFELKSKIGTYLLAVVKNKWLAECRKRRRYTGGELPEEKEDGRLPVLDEIIDAEESRWIQQALDKLDSPCKRLLLLFYFEERNLRDIARIMGFANTDVVKSKKYQCKKSLQKIVTRLLAETERRG